MASIRIRNKTESGGVPGLTKGELAVNLADGVLWVGGTTDTPIYLSGVQTFNGSTGAVTGASLGGNIFTDLNIFQAGISASGATLGYLIVNDGISASGGASFSDALYVEKTITIAASPIQSGTSVIYGNVSMPSTNAQFLMNGINSSLQVTGLVLVGAKGLVVGTGSGISASGGITFNSLAHFTKGLTASGATLGTLVVINGICASGEGRFNNTVFFANGLSANGGSTFDSIYFGGASGYQFVANNISTDLLIVSGGISASGGITLDSPNLTGTPTATTPPVGDDSTSIATTEYVQREIENEGVTSFNGLTGAVGGVCAAQENTFTALQTFNNGISAAGGITFNSLSHFTKGLSGSGATLGTLVVNSGISASGGVTFHNNVYVGGVLTVVEGIEASGGVTFNNTLYVGQTLSVNSDISYSGDLIRAGQAVSVITTYGSTASLPRPGVEGQIAMVTSNDSGYGLYLWDGGISFEYLGITGAWIQITNQTGYLNNPDQNGDGVIDGTDLAFILNAWGPYLQRYYGGTASNPPLGMVIGVGDTQQNAFEVKVYGITTGKKASAFRITSDDAVPQIYMKAGNVEMDSDLTIYPVGDYTTTIKQTGIIDTGYIHVKGLTSGGKGSTYDGNLAVGGLLTLNSGLSAGCGVTFNCLTHFTQGLSASGATLGTLTVNGGATFNGPVYMGATLTMNSNIRFNSGYGVSGGFIDAGWY